MYASATPSIRSRGLHLPHPCAVSPELSHQSLPISPRFPTSADISLPCAMGLKKRQRSVKAQDHNDFGKFLPKPSAGAIEAKPTLAGHGSAGVGSNDDGKSKPLGNQHGSGSSSRIHHSGKSKRLVIPGVGSKESLHGGGGSNYAGGTKAHHGGGGGSKLLGNHHGSSRIHHSGKSKPLVIPGVGSKESLHGEGGSNYAGSLAVPNQAVGGSKNLPKHSGGSGEALHQVDGSKKQSKRVVIIIDSSSSEYEEEAKRVKNMSNTGSSTWKKKKFKNSNKNHVPTVQDTLNDVHNRLAAMERSKEKQDGKIIGLQQQVGQLKKQVDVLYTKLKT